MTSGALILAGMLFATWKSRNTGTVLFAWLWFWIFFLPILNFFIVLNFPMAEHWLYQACIGFFIVAVSWLLKMADRLNWNKIIEPALVAVVLAFAFTTYHASAAWKDEAKRQKLEDLRMLLEGAINALGKVGLMLNVETSNLTSVLQVLPALRRPTVSQLSEDDWLAVNTILDESTVRTIIPALKKAGAQGIVEYPLNKIVM